MFRQRDAEFKNSFENISQRSSRAPEGPSEGGGNGVVAVNLHEFGKTENRRLTILIFLNGIHFNEAY